MKPLATKSYWSETWKRYPTEKLAFSAKKPGFRDFDRLFHRVLKNEPAETLLEVGCYPGRFLWYFKQTFGLRVSGLEYIDWACEKTRDLMRAHEVDAEIIHDDLFQYDGRGRTWDIVTSFGFIEHFTELHDVLQRHLDLLKPGGLLILTFPNHTGFNGCLFKWIDPERYQIHSHISYADVRQTLEEIGGTELVDGGYYGRLGFWNCGLYIRVKKWGILPFFLIRGMLAGVEFLAQMLPNSAAFSPNTGIVVRKAS